MHSLSLMWIVLLVVCFASMELICFPKKRTICQTNVSYIYVQYMAKNHTFFIPLTIPIWNHEHVNLPGRFIEHNSNRILKKIIVLRQSWCYENIECVHWKSHTKQIAVCCAMKSVIAFVAHWMVLFCFVKCDISKIIKDHHEHITQTVERPTMALKERRGKKIGCQ